MMCSKGERCRNRDTMNAKQEDDGTTAVQAHRKTVPAPVACPVIDLAPQQCSCRMYTIQDRLPTDYRMGKMMS